MIYTVVADNDGYTREVHEFTDEQEALDKQKELQVFYDKVNVFVKGE